MMRAQADLLSAALQATPVSVTIADATQRERPLIFVNDAFLRTTGYAADEVLGRNCRFLQGPGTDPHAIDRIRTGLGAAVPISVELLNYKRDGTPFWNALVITPISDAGGHVSAFVGFQVDVTEKRAAAERAEHERRMAALGALASGVAHELNNLIQPILAFPRLIKPALPESATDERIWLEMIEEHARDAGRVVRDILYMARPQGRILEIVEARTVIDRALVAIASTCPPNICIVRSGALVGSDRIGTMRACPTAIVQALLNIARNAVDAMEGGGVLTIGVSVDAGYLAICVSDSGIGMSDAVRDRVFEPFFTTKPAGRGTGLGLAIARADARGWGGDIELQSTPGRGTTVTLRVPLVQQCSNLAPLSANSASA